MENYEFNYHKKWIIIDVLRVISTIIVIIINFVDYSENENYTIFNLLNLIFLSIVVSLVIIYVIWSSVLKKNFEDKIFKGKIIETRIDKFSRIGFLIEYEEKTIESVRMWKPLFIKAYKKEFLDNNKKINQTVCFKLNKQNKKAYCLYIEDENTFENA